MFTVYKKAVERFKEERIEFEPAGVENGCNKLWLSKDGFRCITVFNFESEHAEQETEKAISAFLKLVEINKDLQEKQARKAERARRKAAKGE